MSDWTHPICQPCWDRLYGARQPSRLVAPELEFCCICGSANESGIYFREDPATLARHPKQGHER